MSPYMGREERRVQELDFGEGDWGDISSLVAKQILLLLCFNLWRLHALTYQGINFTPVGYFILRKYVYQQYGKEKASGEGFAL